MDINNSNLKSLLEQIDIETQKSKRLKLCDEIDNLYNAFIPSLEDYVEKLNSTNEYKWILGHFILVLDCGKEISVLQKANRNTSIECLTRNLLEAYGCLKKLLSFYGSYQFNDYIKNLIILDMIQDKKVFNCIKKDASIINSEKKNSEMQTYMIRFEALIEEFFPEKVIEITSSNKEKDIIQIINKLKEKYDKKYPENNNKGISVSMAIKNNKLIQDYDGDEVLYKVLSHQIHNTLSSVEERTLRNGCFMLNNATYNLYPCIELVLYCMKDSYEEFMRIVKSF